MKHSALFRIPLFGCIFWMAILPPRRDGIPVPVKPLSAYDDQVRELMSKMTLDEKIGRH